MWNQKVQGLDGTNKTQRSRKTLSFSHHHALLERCRHLCKRILNTLDIYLKNDKNRPAVWTGGHSWNSPIVECMDVDGVMRRINVNDVVSRIAINDLLDRIDLENLLDRIDWDRQLSRVNFNSILRKIDINDIVGRSDMGAIFAQSTIGVFTTVLDLIRTHIVQVDSGVHHMTRFNFIRQHEGVLPPKPGPARQRDNDRMDYPKGKSNKVIAIQGQYTGFFPKAVAKFLDIGFITVTSAVWLVYRY